jgi:hypothetical protein
MTKETHRLGIGRPPGSSRSSWTDPIPAGWPPPMAHWTDRERDVFERTEAEALAWGTPKGAAWAEAYGAVTRMGPP